MQTKKETLHLKINDAAKKKSPIVVNYQGLTLPVHSCDKKEKEGTGVQIGKGTRK